jgi:hypothetical protein
MAVTAAESAAESVTVSVSDAMMRGRRSLVAGRWKRPDP